MKLKVIELYSDKYTGEVHYPGDVIEVADKARADELVHAAVAEPLRMRRKRRNPKYRNPRRRKWERGRKRMNDLEKTVARALRLSDAAAALLLSEIQRNIKSAEAELIRSGVSKSLMEAQERELVDQAVVTYCLMNMGDEEKYEMYFNAFQYQQDNLRKTKCDEE